MATQGLYILLVRSVGAALALELGAPPAQPELGRDGPALREPKEVDPVRGPGAVAREVRDDGAEKLERGCGVRVGEQLAERVEGVVPLVGLLVEERDPAESTIAVSHCMVDG